MTEPEIEAIASLPWPKIAKYAGQVLASLAIGVGGFVTRGHFERAPEAASPGSMQEQLTLRHWNWRVDCQPFASAPEYGFEARHCPSDASLLIRVVRDGAVVTAFIPPPPEPPPLVLSDGEFSDYEFHWSDAAGVQEIFGWRDGLLELIETPVYAESGAVCLNVGCMYYGDHGAPDGERPVEYGTEREDGWMTVHFRWRDGCVLERYYHRPTGAWSQQACWLRCMGH